MKLRFKVFRYIYIYIHIIIFIGSLIDTWCIYTRFIWKLIDTLYTWYISFTDRLRVYHFANGPWVDAAPGTPDRSANPVPAPVPAVPAAPAAPAAPPAPVPEPAPEAPEAPEQVAPVPAPAEPERHWEVVISCDLYWIDDISVETWLFLWDSVQNLSGDNWGETTYIL